MLCILYVIALGTALGTFGVIVERILPPTWPRRWLWCLIILLSMFIPGYNRTHHNWAVANLPQAQPTHTSLSGSLSAFIESCDPIINKLWFVASAILMLWGLTNALRVWWVLRSSGDSDPDAPARTVVDRVPVVVTDSMGPATVGVFRSRVVVPRWVLALPRIQRQYVLRHEQEHRNAHDARLLFVASLTLILAPWNLALWWLLRRLRLAVEMDCDNRVVGALGNPNAYGELLLKVAQAASRGPRLQPALLGGIGMLERRLTLLIAPTPLKHAQRILLPAAALLLLSVVLWAPHPILGRSHSHVMTSTTTTRR